MKIIKLLFLLLSFLFCINSIDASDNNKNFKSDTIDILHYDINLDIMNFSEKQINGYAKLEITPKINNVNFIPLDLLQLTVDSIFIEQEKITSFFYNDTLLRIPITETLNINDTITASIYYHGQPQVESYGWGGFHFSSNLAYNLGVAFEADPHCYGRVWFPCIDDFVDRAFYDFYIRTEDDKIAVCNGTLLEQTNNGDGTITYHWKLNNTIPTYLASVAVSNYVAVQDTFNGINGDIPTYIYVTPNSVSNAQGTFANLNNILSIYEEHWGAYPWERVGYVGTTQGAMEHATNIAFPTSCITGNLTYEWLYAHELSHMWFGDKVTCSTEGDMWLNEGWAVFNESLYRESLYGKEAYKDNVRTKHEKVLHKAHIIDNGYLALYNVPHEYTYGETVYQKGAGVVHTLRGYLGDSIFFNTMKAYLNEFAYKPASSYDLRDFITSYSGVDVTDFFNGYVFNPGFPHFSVDSFNVTPNGQNFDVEVFVKQKLKGTSVFYNSNKVEVTFMNDNWDKYTDIIEFSGEYGNKVFQLPFNPDVVMLDLDEKICDATTDYATTINYPDTLIFPKTYCQIGVNQISDSVFVRVTHNWVGPDSLKNNIPGLRLSDNRYWKIDGIFDDDFNATARFFYSVHAHLDDSLLTNPNDSLVMLYRKNASEDWHAVDFYKVGQFLVGYIFVDNIKKGEYCLAVWQEAYVGINNNKTQCDDVKIYPNPSSGNFNISYKKNISEIEIYNSIGKLMFKTKLKSDKNLFVWNPENLSEGFYFLNLYSSDKKLLSTKKLVVIK